MRSAVSSQTIVLLCLTAALFVLTTGFSSKWNVHAIRCTLHAEKHSGNDTLPNAGINKISDTVEIEATVDIDAWKQNLEKRLQPVVEKAARKGMKPGLYTVEVRFLIERDGSISDVKALNDPGYGLAKGLEKVIRKGPKWAPGTVNGKAVRSYHTQPVSFVISK